MTSARLVLAASVGNVLEWYDFIVYGFLARQIAAAFFPNGAFPHEALLLTFATFGASFLARPLGAAIIGSYADRRGRRAALTLSIVLMALGTLLLVAMPPYAMIGIWSAFGVLLARLIQGFSAGGEFGGATALMIEHAPQRAGFFGSFQNTTQSLASLAGSVAAWAVVSGLPHAALASWGFRMPFVLGLLIAPAGFYIRRHLPETVPRPDLAPQAPADAATGPLIGRAAAIVLSVIAASALAATRLLNVYWGMAGLASIAAAWPLVRRRKPGPSPVRDLLRLYPGRVALGACTIAVGTASTYLNIYLPTYAQTHLHMAAARSFGIAALLAVAPLFVTPLVGHLSDRTGMLPPMLWGSGLLLILSYPGFLLVQADPTPFVLGAVLLVLTVLRSWYAAAMPGLLAQMFPVALRGAGMSIAYTMGVVVFGGFAQLMLEWLIDKTGNPTMPGIYLTVTAAVTVGALLAIRRLVTLTL